VGLHFHATSVFTSHPHRLNEPAKKPCTDEEKEREDKDRGQSLGS
jgi:hypothetical protein